MAFMAVSRGLAGVIGRVIVVGPRISEASAGSVTLRNAEATLVLALANSQLNALVNGHLTKDGVSYAVAVSVLQHALGDGRHVGRLGLLLGTSEEPEAPPRVVVHDSSSPEGVVSDRDNRLSSIQDGIGPVSSGTSRAVSGAGRRKPSSSWPRAARTL
jgi:hypothetical protein